MEDFRPRVIPLVSHEAVKPFFRVHERRDDPVQVERGAVLAIVDGVAHEGLPGDQRRPDARTHRRLSERALEHARRLAQQHVDGHVHRRGGQQ